MRGIINGLPWAILIWVGIFWFASSQGWIRYVLYGIGLLGFGVIVGTIGAALYDWKLNHVHPQTKHDVGCPVVGGIPADVDHWSCQCHD